MTEDAQNQQRPSPYREWAKQDWAEPDLLLSEITGAGLIDEVEVKVTLIVHGQVIVGKAISAPRWFREQIEKAGEDPETHQSTWAGAYRGLRDRAAEITRITELPEEQDLSEEEIKALLDFTHVVHLKDAEIRLPLPDVTYPPGVYMRVRLSSIDAWFSGSMEPTTPSRTTR